VSWDNTLFQMVLIAGLVYMAATTRRHLLIAGGLGLAVVVLELLELLGPDWFSRSSLQLVIFELLLVYVFWLMIKDLFTAKVVDATILLLAVNCYLVIGILWATFYTLVHASDPGAFVFPATGVLNQPAWKDLYYFSFVTLTTLGYGDIQPVAPLARSLAIAESVCGVLFTGILVARLVGMYGAAKPES